MATKATSVEQTASKHRFFIDLSLALGPGLHVQPSDAYESPNAPRT